VITGLGRRIRSFLSTRQPDPRNLSTNECSMIHANHGRRQYPLSAKLPLPLNCPRAMERPRAYLRPGDRNARRNCLGGGFGGAASRMVSDETRGWSPRVFRGYSQTVRLCCGLSKRYGNDSQTETHDCAECIGCETASDCRAARDQKHLEELCRAAESDHASSRNLRRAASLWRRLFLCPRSFFSTLRADQRQEIFGVERVPAYGLLSRGA
jgi:hypothetical protein